MKGLSWLLTGLALVAAPAMAATPAHKTVVTNKVGLVDAPGLSAEKLAAGATAETEKILADCSGLKFETSVEVGSGADARRTRVKLCSKPGESKESWIASLEQAAAKVDANLDLAPVSREKLVEAIKAEIARLKS